MQTADCRPDTKCRLQSGYKMQTENLKSVCVWFMITCHLTTYQASRNRFFTISSHNYLHYFGIFLAHFLMKINHNIILSLHIVFSLCTWVGWCDVWIDFTSLIKEDVDLECKRDVTIEYLTHATFEKQLTALHMVYIFDDLFFAYRFFRLMVQTKALASMQLH